MRTWQYKDISKNLKPVQLFGVFVVPKEWYPSFQGADVVSFKNNDLIQTNYRVDKLKIRKKLRNMKVLGTCTGAS